MKPKTYFWFVICSIILLAVLGVWDNNFYIGGDVMIPIIPRNNLHKMNMWFAGSDSLHYLHASWYFYYFFLEKLGIASQYAQKILIVLGTTLSFVYTYRLFLELPIKRFIFSRPAAVLSALFYVTSAAVFLVVPGYLPFYGIPICSYYFVRYLKQGRFIDVFLFSILFNIFFFIDLPQPKMIISYSLLLLYLVVLFKKKLLKNVIRNHRQMLTRSILIAVITFVLVNFHILAPFVYSTLSGGLGKVSESISSHNGTADVGSASLLYITRFFNTSSFLNYEHASRVLNGIPFSIASALMLLAILIHNYRYYDLRQKRLWRYSLLAFLVVIFFAKGGNPPFGFIYQWVVERIPLARVFRTTANIIIVGLIPFCVLLSLSVFALLRRTNIKVVLPLLTFVYLLIYGTILTGNRYYNHHNSPPGKGINIPSEYFELSSYLDNLPNNSKVLLLPFPDGYVSKKWGYFGPDLLSWMSKANFLYRSDFYGISTEDGHNLSNINSDYTKLFSQVDYLVVQKDSEETDNFIPPQVAKRLWSNSLADIYKMSSTSTTVSYSPQIDRDNLRVSQDSSSVYKFSITTSSPMININLSENFHKDWRLCLGTDYYLSYSPKHCLSSSVGESNTNLWNLNIDNLCVNNPVNCQKTDQGWYTLSGRLIFWPQTLLVISAWISAVFISTSFVILIVTSSRTLHGTEN